LGRGYSQNAANQQGRRTRSSYKKYHGQTTHQLFFFYRSEPPAPVVDVVDPVVVVFVVFVVVFFVFVFLVLVVVLVFVFVVFVVLVVFFCSSCCFCLSSRLELKSLCIDYNHFYFTFSTKV
jgi:Flp pilus assembly protein TadB